MTRAIRLWPLLTGTQRYEKVVSTRNRGHGEYIQAPILAYLIETPNGRVLYDVGCDYHKVATPELSARYFDPMRPLFDPPVMTEEQRIPGLPRTIGTDDRRTSTWYSWGTCTSIMPAASVMFRAATCMSTRQSWMRWLQVLYSGVFPEELLGKDAWRVQSGDYEVAPGVRAVCTPGHSAGHMSLVIELPRGRPVVICGDAADLQENLTDEIAPGYCWQDNEPLALESIRKLKSIEREERAELWPNHDLAFFRSLPQFPAWRE